MDFVPFLYFPIIHTKPFAFGIYAILGTVNIKLFPWVSISILASSTLLLFCDFPIMRGYFLFSPK